MLCRGTCGPSSDLPTHIELYRQCPVGGGVAHTHSEFATAMFTGKILNVSEDGLALTHFGPAAIEGVVTVQFGLPSAEPQIFQAKAEVVWHDASAMGVRFLRIEPGSLSCFEAWLDSLEGQL
jgi:ribulose-5-phosphate 4-epimerase/fuculose-1-phosphate aldolase